MTVELLTEHHLEFLSYTCSSESTLVKNATLLEITHHGTYWPRVLDAENLSLGGL